MISDGPVTCLVEWDRPDWGGHVTYAANGSWVGTEEAEADQ